jgi:hypothetical protein
MISDDRGEATAEETARVLQLHAELLALAGARQDISAADPAPMSFYLAGSLPLDLDFKQKLLGLRSESERLPLLVHYLEILIPKLRRATTSREKAGGNGHVH